MYVTPGIVVGSGFRSGGILVLTLLLLRRIR